MNEVFADAFDYIALLNPNDQFHAAAVEATRQLQRRVVTTQWVLMEVGDALSDAAVRQRTHEFLVRIAADPNTTLILDTNLGTAAATTKTGRSPTVSASR